MQSLWLIEGDKTYVNVTFWGVRGSIPTPGADTQRWGGNTACLEVRADGCAPLVLDLSLITHLTLPTKRIV